MKAAFYEKFGPASDVIKIGQLEVSELNYGEVLIKVAASGVNYHDTKTRSGWLDLETNIKCLRGNGTIASYSSTKVREPVFPYYALAMKGARLQLLQAGNMPSTVRERATKTILALLDRGKLHPQIAETFRLEEATLAHECVESGERIGDVVIDLQRSQ